MIISASAVLSVLSLVLLCRYCDGLLATRCCRSPMVTTRSSGELRALCSTSLRALVCRNWANSNLVSNQTVDARWIDGVETLSAVALASVGTLSAVDWKMVAIPILTYAASTAPSYLLPNCIRSVGRCAFSTFLSVHGAITGIRKRRRAGRQPPAVDLLPRSEALQRAIVDTRVYSGNHSPSIAPPPPQNVTKTIEAGESLPSHTGVAHCSLLTSIAPDNSIDIEKKDRSRGDYAQAVSIADEQPTVASVSRRDSIDWSSVRHSGSDLYAKLQHKSDLSSRQTVGESQLTPMDAPSDRRIVDGSAGETGESKSPGTRGGATSSLHLLGAGRFMPSGALLPSGAPPHPSRAGQLGSLGQAVSERGQVPAKEEDPNKKWIADIIKRSQE